MDLVDFLLFLASGFLVSSFFSFSTGSTDSPAGAFSVPSADSSLVYKVYINKNKINHINKIQGKKWAPEHKNIHKNSEYI